MKNDNIIDKLLNKKTHFIVRYGITFMSVSVLLLFLLSFFIRFDISISNTAIQSAYIGDKDEIILSLNTSYIEKLKKNQEIKIQFKNEECITGKIVEIQNSNKTDSTLDLFILLKNTGSETQKIDIDNIKKLGINNISIGEYLFKPLFQSFKLEP